MKNVVTLIHLKTSCVDAGISVVLFCCNVIGISGNTILEWRSAEGTKLVKNRNCTSDRKQIEIGREFSVKRDETSSANQRVDFAGSREIGNPPWHNFQQRLPGDELIRNMKVMEQWMHNRFCAERDSRLRKVISNPTKRSREE